MKIHHKNPCEIRKFKSDGGPKQSRHRKFHIKIEPENSTDTYVTFFDVKHFERFPASLGY